MIDFFINKVFIITGASSGLGLEISKNLVEKGCQVVLFARNLSPLKKGKWLQLFKGSLFFPGDVTQIKDVQGCIKKTVEKFGRIDGMVLNAGKSMWKQFLDLKTPQEMKEIMDVNYWGVVNFCYYGLSNIKNFHGRIVIISSLQSIIGTPYHTGYSASKHALNGFIDSLRLEEEVSILNVVVSWIRGTSLRKNSLGFKQNSKENKNGIFSISVTDCAQKIIDTIPSSRKIIYLPKIIHLFPLVKFFFPNWLNKKIKKTVYKEIHLHHHDS